MPYRSFYESNWYFYFQFEITPFKYAYYEMKISIARIMKRSWNVRVDNKLLRVVKDFIVKYKSICNFIICKDKVLNIHTCDRDLLETLFYNLKKD